MKPLRLLAATVAAWVSALVAQAGPLAPPASLTVTAEQGQPFGLVLDGRALTWPVARQVRTGPLAPGWHRADVSVPGPAGPPLRFSTQVWLEPGRDNPYLLVMRRSGPQLRPVTPTAGAYPAPGAPAYPGPGAYPAPTTPAPGAYPGGNGYPGTSGYPTQPAPGGSYPAPPVTSNNYPTPGGSYPAPGGGYPAPAGGYYPGGSYLQPLAPAELARLQQSVSQRSFDDDRLAIIKQALSGSLVQADELTALVRMLSFDRSRIELAKYGYAHVGDQQNFYRVYDALQFSSSVREVQDALGLPR